MFNTLNKTRDETGVEPLTLSSDLTQGSRKWSCTTAETGSFEHDSDNFAHG